MTPLTVKPDKDHQCALHKHHIPVPKMLHIHHVIPLEFQKETGIDIPTQGNTAIVCPTGHYNIHALIQLGLLGKISLGRKGVTGRLAEQAVTWYKENRK